MAVPTVISPGSQKGSWASKQACSIKPIMCGVEKTGGNASLNELSVCLNSTTRSTSARVPIGTSLMGEHSAMSGQQFRFSLENQKQNADRRMLVRFPALALTFYAIERCPKGTGRGLGRIQCDIGGFGIRFEFLVDQIAPNLRVMDV